MEKIENVEIQQAILHDVMFMSIELEEHIETFKEWGKIKVLLMTHGLVIFGPIIINLVRVHKCDMRLFITCS
jgi:hypothetical protein